jgi:membrane protein YdbS with pleckstrin-like domain
MWGRTPGTAMAATVPSAPRNPPRFLKATYLADTETLLRETRATGLFYFPGPILAFIVVGFLTYTVATSDYGWPAVPGLTNFWNQLGMHVSIHVVLLFFLVILLIVALWLLVRYLHWISTVYAVTTTRVIVQSGIFGRNFDEIPVQQVRGVDIHQSFGQRILGYGTVRVSSEGGSRLGNEDWRGIPKPFEFQRLIENATARGSYPGANMPTR